MKRFYIVHGFVQGVGYRWFVRNVAKRNGIIGIVRNMPDGSVQIVAVGNADSIARFEKEIEVSIKQGPEVHSIERFEDWDSRFPDRDFEKFIVEK